MEAKEQNIGEMDDVVKQLMEILEKQNMREQSQDFMEVVQYVAGMQVQLAVMVDELHGVKEQLADMQAGRRSAKDSLLKTAAQLEGKITRLSEKLSEAKDRLIETAAQAVRAFKEKGQQEMNKVIRKGISGVQKLLDSIREQMVDVLTGYEKTANQINSIGDELKQIGNSAANVGRLLSGRGTKEVSDEKQGVGLTRAMNMPIKKAIAGLKKNLDRIDRMSEKLEKICEKPEPEKAAEKGARASLKEKLAQMQEKAGGQNRQPDMEKADKKKQKGKEAVI